MKPNVVSASYPYPNVLAHGLHDCRHIIKTNVAKFDIPPGELEVHVFASDGCDGFGDWDLISEKTNVELPDHGLSYDCKIIKIEAVNHRAILFEDFGASVHACKPILRAAANENDHFATHSVTIPVERQRSALEKVRMKVKLDEGLTLS